MVVARGSGIVGGGGKLLINGHKISAKQDEYILEICLLYNIVPIVHKTVLYTLKFAKRIDLILRALTTIKRKKRD